MEPGSFIRARGWAAPRLRIVLLLAAPAASQERKGSLRMTVFGAVGAKVYVTAWNGAVEVVSDGSTISVKSER